MKNRRIAIIAFVLVAVMAIGVGYAAVADTLTASGKVAANTDAAFDSYIQWGTGDNKPTLTRNGTGSVVDPDKTNATVGNPSGGTASDTNDLLTITVDAADLSAKGDYVTVSAKVVSTAEISANLTITAITDDLADEYFQVTALFGDQTTMILAGGQTVECTITIKLIKTLVKDIEAGGEFRFMISAVPIATP